MYEINLSHDKNKNNKKLLQKYFFEVRKKGIKQMAAKKKVAKKTVKKAVKKVAKKTVKKVAKKATKKSKK